MHFSTLALLGGLAASAIATTTSLDCVADNCLRAVRASAFPTRAGTADCSSYFLTTVTPATHTSTVFATFTATVYDKKKRRREIRRRSPTPGAKTVIPSSIPSYASACSGSVRYSSACSCIGVTGTITTVPTPSTVVTVTSATVTTTIMTTTSTTSTSTTTTTTTTTTTPVVHPSVVVQAYLNENCSPPVGFLGPNTLTAGACGVIAPSPLSLEQYAIQPGSCLDTSDCYIEYYYSEDCSGSAEVVKGPNPGCVTDDINSGLFVCPGC